MYLVEVVTMALVGSLSDRRGRRLPLLCGTGSGVVGVVVLGLATGRGWDLLFFAAALPLGLAGGCLLSLLPTVLVDLPAGPEVGLTAARISRDLGLTACTVLAGGVISLAGTFGVLALAIGLFVFLAVGMAVVGETRARPALS